MSSFGDFEEADAFDTAPADAEQVARKLHRLRFRAGLEDRPWSELGDEARARRVAIVAELLAWLRRQGAR